MCADVGRVDLRPEVFERNEELFPCQNPRYPDMRDIDSRINSFDEYSSSSQRGYLAPKLAQAGFFYSRITDDIVCWYCGGGLDDGDYRNDPWYSHSKYHSQCEFVLREKGIDYVTNVVSFTPEFPRTTSSHTRFTENHERSQPPNVDIFPRPQWQRHQIDLGLLQTATVYNSPGIQVATMMHQQPRTTTMIHQQPRTTTIMHQQPRTTQNFEVTTNGTSQLVSTANSLHTTHSRLTREALDMGFSLNQIKAAMSRRLLEQGQVQQELSDLINDIVDSERQNPTNSSVSVSTNSNTSAPSSPSTSAPSSPNTSAATNSNTTSPTSIARNSTNSSDIQHQSREAEQRPSSIPTSTLEKMCTICDRVPCKLLFLPCAHLITCRSCGCLLNYCPACHAVIERWIKVKISVDDE